MRFEFPSQAKYGRVIPKSKIYEHASIGGALRQRFIGQIDKIVWSYKLAEETLHLPATEKVPEIEIFDIYLKGDTIDEAVLKAIDRAIPLPILFILHRSGDGALKIKAAYKRPSEADSHKWVIESYFETDWLPADTPAEPLPVALDLEKLYAQLIKALMPQTIAETAKTGDIEAEVERAKRIEALEREYRRLKAKRDREKQFNKKVQINGQMHTLKIEIDELKLPTKQ
ncbi:DUF4391 domain-containing protein [Hydrogenimonas urashimensis]|uniref:DUF4391 domain-containing protein n=1 Tax=Hydrogenimonas urashimensis TaxID=2740515 RepID=UPI0019169FE9|nr:DUF4391 domain-containing protein [Hydrogenimonas urashimensis]